MLHEILGYWFVQAFLFITVVAYAKRTLDIKIQTLNEVVREFRQLFRGDRTIGAVNAGAIVAVTVVGVIILLLSELHTIVGYLTVFGIGAKGAEFEKSVNITWLFMGIVAIAIVSVWATSRTR